MKKKPQPTSVQIDPALWKLVAHEAIERGKSKTDAVHEGLRWWLTAETGHKTPTDAIPPVVVDHADVQPVIAQDIIEQSKVTIAVPAELHGAFTAFLDAYARRSDTGERAASLRAEVEEMERRIGPPLGLEQKDPAADKGSGGEDSHGRAKARDPRDRPAKKKRA